MYELLKSKFIGQNTNFKKMDFFFAPSLLKRDGVVEEACAPSISYQVQTRHRHKKIEKRMLIGISIRSVTSKRSCALDDSPSGERVLSRRRERVGKHLKL